MYVSTFLRLFTSRLPLVTKWSAVKSAASAVSAPRVKEKEGAGGGGKGAERRRGKGKDGELLFILPGMVEAFPPPRGRKPIKPGCPAARMYRK